VEAGLDAHSVCADPKLADLEERAFALDEELAAFGLGWEALDLSAVVPR
jgi:hypothetical protein